MNKNQNGFATLEIILVIGIIAIFSTVAVPKMARILDKVALDYELKHLYSELNFARSIGKSSMIDDGIFNTFNNTGSGQIEFWIYSRKYGNANFRNRYQIRRPAVTSFVYYRHKLTNGVELEIVKSYDTMEKVTFNNKSRYDNWSKTLQFSSSSKLNKTTAEVTFDSVGRWRGTYVK